MTGPRLVASNPRIEPDQAFAIVVLGHVDHGKSSLVGRLLHDTDSLPAGRVEQLREVAERRGREFEWSFAIDALQVERDKGITLDTSRIWFRTAQRRYAVIDAPGHREFLRNMITGAAAAEAAVLVIDAQQGMCEQTRRHAYLARLLGIDRVVVAINKIDLIEHDPVRFQAVADEVAGYLRSLGIAAIATIPLSARHGDNVVRRRESTAWYGGPTLTEALDRLPASPAPVSRPLRLPVQDVYKLGPRQVIVGRIEAGRLRIGDTLRFSPSGRIARVAGFEAWRPTRRARRRDAGQSVAFTLDEDIAVQRGEIASGPATLPFEAHAISAKLFWLGAEPLVAGRVLRLRLATAVHEVEVRSVDRVIDVADLKPIEGAQVETHGVAEVTLVSTTRIVADRFSDSPSTGRGVLLDGFAVVGACVVESIATRADRRFTQPMPNSVALGERERANGHRAGVLWLTGLPGSGKTTLAMAVQRRLFERRRQVVVIDGDAIRQTLNRDLGFEPRDRAENIRRVAELSASLRDAGFIVISALVSPSRADRATAREIVGHGFHEVHVRASIEACRKRDPKGLYARADRGEVQSVTGVTAAYEEPLEPELAIDTERQARGRSIARLDAYAERQFALDRARIQPGGVAKKRLAGRGSPRFSGRVLPS